MEFEERFSLMLYGQNGPGGWNAWPATSRRRMPRRRAGLLTPAGWYAALSLGAVVAGAVLAFTI
jgi:hypothetical protein